MKILKIKMFSTMYSTIILEDNSEHTVPNNGWLDLKYWINYFTKEYKNDFKENLK